MSHHLTSIIVDPLLAKSRIKNFIAKKNKIDNDVHCNVNNEIKYDPAVYISLLDIIYKNSSGYRVYFVHDAKGSKDEINIVYAITDGNANNTGEFYMITNNGGNLISIPRTNAQKLITDIKAYLDAARKTNPKNIETESIFYNTDNLQQLINFLTQHLADLELVTVKFAAYCDELDPAPANDDDKNYSHQLSLLFELITKNPIEGEKEIFFASGTKIVNGATSEVDTGVPCPPPPSGTTTCPGA